MLNLSTQRAISTWSIHRLLGQFAAPGSAIDGGSFIPHQEMGNRRTLIDLIPEIAEHGYHVLQICHFHLESSDPAYLGRLRTTLKAYDVSFDMLLIDEGDLTDPDFERQMAWYDDWLNVAAMLGAKRARIGAGKQSPTPKRLRASGERLGILADGHPDVRIVTENWLGATPDAESLLDVLEAAGESVGLLIDLGNWTGPDKYTNLAKIAGRAEACHAKCHFTDDGPDEADFCTALALLKDVDFNGPIALIYDGPDPDEWVGLELEWKIVESVWS